MKLRTPIIAAAALGLVAAVLADGAEAQMRDIQTGMTLPTTNAADGIKKTLTQEIGAGRGSLTTVDSSIYIINRDPFRAIRRGRQIFQRKFLPSQGFGGRDRIGNIHLDPSIGAGIVDSCAGCHGRPRGAAGFGGDVFTRPDSRDAPHLFGLGLQEMLADEITKDLRTIRDGLANGQSAPLTSKGINYGTISKNASGTVITTGVVGVDPDLRVRPFFAQGGTISIREFLVGAFNAEMGIQSDDPDLVAAAINRTTVTTPSGMVLDGTKDAIEAPPVTPTSGNDPDADGITNELPVSLVDFSEFYLLHYFKPAKNNGIDSSEQEDINDGRTHFVNDGCANCHKPDLTINRDRRIADVETLFNSSQSNPFNRLFATASAFPFTIDDPPPDPVIKTFANNQAFPQSAAQPPRSFVVRNIFTDFKRHDIGSNFYERFHDNRVAAQRLFMTEPLWGAGTTAPYGHDGRTHNFEEVIRRHGGEAASSVANFLDHTRSNKEEVLMFLRSLILFGPDDTASNLAGINTNPPAPPGGVVQPYPQGGHGSIALSALFNNPSDGE